MGKAIFYLKLADTIAWYKNLNLKPRNRISWLESRNLKRTIARYKSRNLRPRNRIGGLKNRDLKRTETIGRYKNQNLTSTACIIWYNRKIESVSEDRSIGPFAHLWLQLNISAISILSPTQSIDDFMQKLWYHSYIAVLVTLYVECSNSSGPNFFFFAKL
jgi:hypothetical protein